MTTLEIRVGDSLIGVVAVKSMKLLGEGYYLYSGKFAPVCMEGEQRKFTVKHYGKDGILVLYRKILEELTD